MVIPSQTRAAAQRMGGILALLLIAIPGCGILGPSGVTFSVERGEYRVGETVSVLARNHSDTEVRITDTGCGFFRERLTADGWVFDPDNFSRMCPQYQTVPAGVTWIFSIPVSEEYVEGETYRFTTRVEYGPTRTWPVYSASFRILPAD